MSDPRLCRSSSASAIQLRILPPSKHPHLPYLHCLQRFATVMASIVTWLGLFCHWILCAQVSAPVRHGPPTALDRRQLDHDL